MGTASQGHKQERSNHFLDCDKRRQLRNGKRRGAARRLSAALLRNEQMEREGALIFLFSVIELRQRLEFNLL